MKKLILTALATLLPGFALAHGKWLVPDYENVIASQHGTYDFYTFQSIEVSIWIVITFMIIVSAGLLHRYLPDWSALTAFSHRNKRYIDYTAQFVLGVFLVSTALFWNVVILPAESVSVPILVTLKYLQVAIGMMFVLHISPRYASMGLLILSIVVTLTHGMEAILENVVLYSLAIYFYLVHTPVHGVWSFLQRYAIDIVRIGTGVSLISLAFTEKLLYPELGMQFLVVHHWNFMQPLFPWFSNELFVLSTGFAEMIFGIVFILGYVTRITTIVIATFFALSVTTMLAQSSVWEVEDFVVYCAAILLFFFSHGHTTFPEMIKKIF